MVNKVKGVLLLQWTLLQSRIFGLALTQAEETAQ